LHSLPERYFRGGSIVFSSEARVMDFEGKRAIVTGASSGIGRATAVQLAREGARVVGVARGAGGLAALGAEEPRIETVEGDASDPAIVERLLREVRPELVVLAAGVKPRMAPIEEQTWESFTEAWESDTRSAFHFVRSAITLPLAPGSTIVIVSSGAAVNGSHLSGGYAGAKRMSWWLAGYAQQQADARALGLRFRAVLPKQLVVGTEIAANAASAYGAWSGVSSAEFMGRFDSPLLPDAVASAVLDVLRAAPEAIAVGVTARGVEPIA
jgi:NAD(P)-dependent dehydrogenase (short-subunit alcohol dehydrogenase family)